MAHIDNLLRAAIGFDFDKLARLADDVARNSGTFPPYDIRRISQTEYMVTLAVAGFSADEISITTENGNLRVKGNPSKEDETVVYEHRGIAHREFERSFALADHVEVTAAFLADGLLHVHLRINVPEERKPRSVPINAG